MHILKTLALTVTLALATSAFAQDATFVEPRVMLPPPGSKVTGGFMMVNNNGKDTLELHAATSDLIPHVELHLTSITDGVAKMEEQPSISIPAGESLEFKRGSYHLMFMDLEQPLEEGQTINVTLETNRGEIEIPFTVESMMMAPGMTHAKAEKAGDDLNSNAMKNPMPMDDKAMPESVGN